MGNFRKLYVIGGLVFGCVLVALLGRSAVSQTSNPKESEVGRYQLVSHSTGVSSQVILLDTKTGHIWAKTTVYSPTKKTYEGKWIEENPFTEKNAPQ